jgi:NTE family protein
MLPAGGPLDCPPEATMALANLPTRLDGMTPQVRDRLINWGYASAEAALRTWPPKQPGPPPSFPRAGGVG